MTDPFAKPGAAGGGFKPAEHKGALLLITVNSLEHNVSTPNGPADPARADVVVLDGAAAGEVFEDTLIFGKVLVSQLRARVGQKVLGRLGQGVEKAGQSPPWILQDPTDADRAVGVKYLSEHMATAAAPPF